MPYYNTNKMAERKILKDLDYIEHAINSFSNQTLSDIELVFVDDGTHDKRVTNYVKKCATTDSRIKVIESPKNIGAGAARNLALENSTGEFVKYLDADDTFPSNDVLETMYNTAKAKDAQIVLGQIRYAKEDGVTPLNSEGWKPTEYEWERYNDHAMFGRTYDVQNNEFDVIYEKEGIGESLYARELFDDTTGFPHIKWEDHAFIPILKAKANKVAVIDKQVYSYRAAVGNTTSLDVYEKSPRILEVLEGSNHTISNLESIFTSDPIKSEIAIDRAKKLRLYALCTRANDIIQWKTSDVEKKYLISALMAIAVLNLSKYHQQTFEEQGEKFLANHLRGIDGSQYIDLELFKGMSEERIVKTINHLVKSPDFMEYSMEETVRGWELLELAGLEKPCSKFITSPSYEIGVPGSGCPRYSSYNYSYHINGFVQLHFHCACATRNENLVIARWSFLIYYSYVFFLTIISFSIYLSNICQFQIGIDLSMVIIRPKYQSKGLELFFLLFHYF